MASNTFRTARRCSGRAAISFAAACCLALLVTATPPALAASGAKAAATMAQQAMKAYASGDYARAAQLYLQAWQTDKDRPEYLYAAARAEHVAGLADRALDYYRQALGCPDLPAAQRNKAEQYTKELTEARADALGAEADKAVRSGDHRLATQLYRDALMAAPHRLSLLFRLAVTEQAAGDSAAAARDFDLYLEKAPADAAERAQAQLRRSALDADGRATPLAEKTGAPAPSLQAKGTATGPDWLAWSAVAAGVALAGGGAALLAAQSSDRRELDAQLASTDGGHIVGTWYDDYAEKRDRLNSNYRNAALLGGAGLGLCGWGAWMLLHAPTPAVAVAMAPTVRGPGLTIAWRF